MQISGRTQVVGIIGDPVAHSLSPAMHNAAFRALKLDYAYVAFPVLAAQVRQAMDGIRALGIAGVNVTVPHKERVIKWLDTVSPTARRAGAVNTIVNRDGRLHGENTDVTGFLRALQDVQFSLRDSRALVIGAGGVARAVLTALAEGKAAGVTVANRTIARARRLVRTFKAATLQTTAAPLAVLRDHELLGGIDLVVNATSLGLHGERFFPLHYGATSPSCLFVDLIYGRRTDFLAHAARSRRRTLDGSGMLVHQGAAAFTLWTGRAAPVAAMRAALRTASPEKPRGRRTNLKIDKGPTPE
ncbi:MAG TPA: shikimate dehydrogenase [Candidatus Margulisiibacteriota bacterium]|nr:shikimate dehydrogenase [Candidatus Margulisiibacteriota bacterium]